MEGIQETCIVCGAKTEYKFDTPIFERKHYYEGAGQLCRNCFLSLQIEESGALTPIKHTRKDYRVILPFEFEKEYTVTLKNYRKKPIYTAIKRLFDFLFSFVALLTLLPLMIFIALTIKCASKGSIFYLQPRLGYKGKTICVPKFRTMRTDAEKDGAQWSKGENDERIFPFGRFLRKTRLDELPQLWCCVIGTMSLIGPRPERECFAVEFEKHIHGFSERLKVKPGITGWAQINGGYDLKPEEKIIFDIEYIEKRSIWFDIKILFKTVAVVFNHKGAK